MLGLEIGTIIGIFGVVVAIGLWIYDKLHRDKERRGGIFRIVWKSVKRMKPSDIMRDRGTKNGNFDPFYLEIPESERLIKLLSAGKNVLVLGDPLAGKTRLVFEALTKLKRTDLIIPHTAEIDVNHFKIPRNPHFGVKKFVFFGDLQRFIELKGFKYMFDEFAAREDIPLIATCRKGIEFSRVEKMLGASLRVFDETITLEKLSIEDSKAVAEKIGKQLPSNFDGNIGTLIFGLSEIKNRFSNDLPVGAQKVLRCIKSLYFAGIYNEEGLYERRYIEFLLKKSFNMEITTGEWQEITLVLVENSFATRSTYKNIFVDSAYLTDDVISIPPLEKEDAYLDFAHEISEYFADDPVALTKIYRKLFSVAKTGIMNYDLFLLSTRLSAICFELLPQDDTSGKLHAAINTAESFNDLALIKDTPQNTAKALEWLDKALENCDDKDSFHYGYIQMQRGLAYRVLAFTGGRSEDIDKALHAFDEAQSLLDPDKNLREFTKVQYFRGILFGMLSNSRDKKDNLQRSIEELEKILDRRDKVKAIMPKIIGGIYDTIGLGYYKLASSENREENLLKAGEYFEKVIAYGNEISQTDLVLQGIKNAVFANSGLGECKKDISYLDKARDFANEGLQLVTLEKAPRYYGELYMGLGKVCAFKGLITKDVSSLEEAIEHTKEALKANPKDASPVLYASSLVEIGNYYRDIMFLSKDEKAFRRSLEIYKETLEIYQQVNSPGNIAKTMGEIADLLHKRADISNKPGIDLLAALITRRAGGIFREIGMTENADMLASSAAKIIESAGEIPATLAGEFEDSELFTIIEKYVER